jgi:molybdopterin molybdotransferase
MLSFDQALARLLGAAQPVGVERVPLAEAGGRVLAEDVVAPGPLPPFDFSAMDGYALASHDIDGAGPWDLRVSGESAAGGHLPDLEPGTACRIFTGARLPPGADAVVMQERVERTGDVIRMGSPVSAGAHVRRRGEDLAGGAVALGRGARLTPGRVALAAALDRPELLVARRPIVTVLCSGDELRAPGQMHPVPRPGSIPESNGYFVAAAARAAGALARVAPFVPDEAEAARLAVEGALRGTDVVVTIGGVSVGDRDVMRGALEAAGVTLDFWKVKIKPGKPLAVGRAGSVQALGLPGNPASASLTFLLFGVPLLRALQGDAAPLPPRLRAVLRSSVVHEPGRDEFLRAQLDVEHGELGARILPNQSSGAVTSFAEADALVVIPADRARIDEGSAVEVIRLSDV